MTDCGKSQKLYWLNVNSRTIFLIWSYFRNNHFDMSGPFCVSDKQLYSKWLNILWENKNQVQEINRIRTLIHKQIVHKIVSDDNSMVRFPLVLADSERNMPGSKPRPLGWHTSALTNERQEVRQLLIGYYAQ